MGGGLYDRDSRVTRLGEIDPFKSRSSRLINNSARYSAFEICCEIGAPVFIGVRNLEFKMGETILRQHNLVSC